MVPLGFSGAVLSSGAWQTFASPPPPPPPPPAPFSCCPASALFLLGAPPQEAISCDCCCCGDDVPSTQLELSPAVVNKPGVASFVLETRLWFDDGIKSAVELEEIESSVGDKDESDVNCSTEDKPSKGTGLARERAVIRKKTRRFN